MNKKKVVILSLFICLLMTGGYFDSKGMIKGKVKDKDNNPIQGAKVKPESMEGQADIAEVKTDEDGDYLTGEMNNGIYMLKVTKDGYKVKNKYTALNFTLFSNGDGFNCSNNLEVDITLYKEGEEEAVESEGIVALWHMDEDSWSGTADEVVDASGNGYHGVAAGNVTTTEGKFGRCGIFDGVDDKAIISYTGLAIEEGFNDFTTMFWAIPDYSVQGPPLSKGFWKVDGFFWYVDPDFPNYPMFFFISNAGDRIYSAIDPGIVEYRDSNWHHFASVRKNGWINLYVDGTLIYNGDWSGFHVDAATRDMYLGYYERDNKYYKGKIDDVALYNKALTEQEIYDIYNSGQPIQ